MLLNNKVCVVARLYFHNFSSALHLRLLHFIHKYVFFSLEIFLYFFSIFSGSILQLVYAIVIAVIVHSAHAVAEPDDDKNKSTNNNNNVANVTNAVSIDEEDESSSGEFTTEPVVPAAAAVDLVQQENENLTNETHEEKSTAKRTVNYHNQKFSGPIVVREEGGGGDNLFTPADDYARKQINVQIIEPESHNNGQFLKETLFQREENSTTITSTTTTERSSINGLRRSGVAQKSISNKFLAPIQAGLRLSNDERKAIDDDDCDDNVENGGAIGQKKEEKYVEIQKNTKAQKIIVENTPLVHKKGSIFGSRFSTTTKAPCDQTLPCSTLRPPVAVPTYPRHQQNIVVSTIRQPQNLIVTTARPISSSVHSVHSVHAVQTAAPVVATPPKTHIVHQPVYVEVPVEKTRVVQQPVYVHTHSQVPVEKTRIVQQPVYVHTQTEVPVEKVVKQLVKIPYPVEVEKLVVKEVPIDRVVEKHVNHAIPVDRPYPVEKVVEKLVHVPYEVEKIVDRPVEIEKIVEKAVPVDRIIDRYIDRPIPIEVGVPVFVEVPIHSAYPVHIPVPYLVKPPPPPPPKHFLITKTTKYTKGHGLGLFDFKRNHKHVKHVIVKPPPSIVSDEILSHPPDIELSPPPR